MACTMTMEKVARPELAQHESSILDLVFVMDCTASMMSYIASATDNIRAIVEEIVVSEKSDIRLALVEYRDHPPQDHTFVTRVHDFTAKVSEMKGWLEQCQAVGGGDAPEAVADGLHAVLKLSWRAKATKICLLIADAPPHGLDPDSDGFPNGCPCGLDPVQTIRQMAEKHITLYSIGVEPPITRYRDFFMSLAYTTGGQYVPMVNAKLLAKVIIGGVREEISLDRLMEAAEEDINREMQRAEAEGADEREKVKRINHIFSTQNLCSTQMNNTFGAASVAAKTFSSTCHNMAQMQSAFVATSPPVPSIFGTGAPVGTAFAPSTSLFGSITTFTPASSGSSIFGAPSTAAPGAVPLTATTSSTFTFGAPTAAFGAPSFGFGAMSTTTPSTNPFSFTARSNTSSFAPTTSIFGSGATSTPASSGSFTFGAPVTTSHGFGATATTAPSPHPFSFATSTDSSVTNGAAPATGTVADINYDVTENAAVNEEQAERIYQKWQHRKT